MPHIPTKVTVTGAGREEIRSEPCCQGLSKWKGGGSDKRGVERDRDVLSLRRRVESPVGGEGRGEVGGGGIGEGDGLEHQKETCECGHVMTF